MGLVVLFYYTLIILLVSIMTSAMCLSTFLVTHRKYLGFACIGFLFYFFDVALVFLDDFTVNSTGTMPESVYFIGSQVTSIVTGCGLFTAFWLMVCDALDEHAAHCKSRLPSCSSSRAWPSTHLCHQATRTSSCFTACARSICFG